MVGQVGRRRVVFGAFVLWIGDIVSYMLVSDASTPAKVQTIALVRTLYHDHSDPTSLADGRGEDIRYWCAVHRLELRIQSIAVSRSSGQVTCWSRNCTYFLSGVEHGPFPPWLLSRVSQPSAEIRIPHDEREDRRR